MIGIYRIYNMIAGQSYIDQSRDIAKRIEEHFYHRKANKASYIDQAINKFGINNFVFQILELCDFNNLDQKEEFWINYFRSNIYGYNIINGGQHNIGESNANHKLTSNDIYNIREAYNRHENPKNVYYNYYKDKVSLTYFYNIWEGKNWTDIHMDVYTDENKYYFKSLINIQRNYAHKRYSDEEVLNFRKRYVNETAEEIYNSIITDLPFNTFKSILNGNSYKHIPIYNKKKKEWNYE